MNVRLSEYEQIKIDSNKILQNRYTDRRRIELQSVYFTRETTISDKTAYPWLCKVLQNLLLICTNRILQHCVNCYRYVTIWFTFAHFCK